MAGLGGAVSVIPPTEPIHQATCIGVFIFLGGFAGLVVMGQSQQAARAEAESRNQINRLEASTAEVTKLQTLNNDLQQQALTDQDECISYPRTHFFNDRRRQLLLYGCQLSIRLSHARILALGQVYAL